LRPVEESIGTVVSGLVEGSLGAIFAAGS
jgi:hypothetical protein